MIRDSSIEEAREVREQGEAIRQREERVGRLRQMIGERLFPDQALQVLFASIGYHGGANAESAPWADVVAEGIKGILADDVSEELVHKVEAALSELPNSDDGGGVHERRAEG